jgi:hypothetical protein
MLANVYFVWTDLPLVLAAGPLVLRGVTVLLVIGGLLRLGRRGVPLAAPLVAFYIAALAGYAYATPRYTVPLVPIEYVALVVAASDMRRSASRATAVLRPVVACLAIAPAVVLLAANLLWLQRFAAMPATQLRGAFGRPMPFPWTGYAEVIDWTRRNTRPTDVIASGNDTMYYLYTRRQTVRPWVNRPELYFPLYRVRADTSGDAALVSREFERLGVTYFVQDPSLPDPEGLHAGRTVTGFLALDDWQRVHVTRDGGHTIWRRSTRP